MERNLKELISEMTLEEKAGMCSGFDFWYLKGVDRLGFRESWSAMALMDCVNRMRTEIIWG